MLNKGHDKGARKEERKDYEQDDKSYETNV